MKTAYLIYRPVMDYEESEESYLICKSRDRAEKVRDEMIHYAKILLQNRLESLYDEDGNTLPDAEYSVREEGNYESIKSANWPYGINLGMDSPWRDFRPHFNEKCISIRELPLV